MITYKTIIVAAALVVVIVFIGRRALPEYVKTTPKEEEALGLVNLHCQRLVQDTPRLQNAPAEPRP